MGLGFLTSDEWMAIPKTVCTSLCAEEDDEAYDIWTKKARASPRTTWCVWGKEDNSLGARLARAACSEIY